jgi:hypothetical protein
MSWAVKIFAEGSSLSVSHEKLSNVDNIKVKIKTSSDRRVSLEELNPTFCTYWFQQVHLHSSKYKQRLCMLRNEDKV